LGCYFDLGFTQCKPFPTLLSGLSTLLESTPSSISIASSVIVPVWFPTVATSFFVLLSKSSFESDFLSFLFLLLFSSFGSFIVKVAPGISFSLGLI